MKGPNGTRDDIPAFFANRSGITHMAPTQKEKRDADNALEKPRRSEVARINFASPRPIHLPFEKNHKRKKEIAIANAKIMFSVMPRPR